MGLKEEAEALMFEIDTEGLRLRHLAWELERILHNRRLSAVGSSGIQHRQIKPLDIVDQELKEKITEVRNQWRAQ